MFRRNFAQPLMHRIALKVWLGWLLPFGLVPAAADDPLSVWRLLNGVADLTLAVHVMHETAYPHRFLTSCHQVLRCGGKLLILEPKRHVTVEEFDTTRHLALDVGFVENEFSDLRNSLTLLLENRSELG